MDVKISTMSGKLEGIKAINTNTLSNHFCKKMVKSKNKKVICNDCYSWKMLSTFRKNAIPSFEHNSKLLSNKDIDYIPYINQSLFRFNAHGELINELHLNNLVKITKKNPQCIFTLWTKRKDIITNYFLYNDKPKNLILIYSNALVDTIKNPPMFFDKSFNNVSSDSNKINCKDKCINCRLCYSKNDVKIIIEKKK